MIPLLPGDPEVTLDLQAVFDQAYDAGPYTRQVEYSADPVVPYLRGYLRKRLQAEGKSILAGAQAAIDHGTDR